MKKSVDCVEVLDGKFTLHLLYRSRPEAREIIDQTDIVKLLTKSLKTASKYLGYSGVNVLVRDENGIKEMGGVTGYAPNPYEMYINLDYKHPKFLENIPIRLPQTVSHELHHNKRNSTVGYGTTLLEASISEGLATHCEHELYPKLKIPWTHAFKNKKEEKEIWELARKKLHYQKYSHGKWFFGKSKSVPEVPRWAGYTLGYNLIKDYKRTHRGETSVSLVSTSAREIMRGVNNW